MRAALGLLSTPEISAGGGALTLTPQGEVEAYNGSGGTMTVTSASFTPAAGSLLVAIIVADNRCNAAGGTISASTVAFTDTIGGTGGGAWTRRADCRRPPTYPQGSYIQNVEIWTRLIGTSPGSGTVTANITHDAATTCADLEIWLNMVEITGQHASPIGGSTGSTSRQVPGSSSYALDLGTAPAASSAVFTVLYDYFDVNVPAAPSGYTSLYDQIPTGNSASARSAYKNGSTAQNFSWTGLNTADGHLAAAIEVKAA